MMTTDEMRRLAESCTADSRVASALRQAADRIDALTAGQAVPGAWYCPTCGFQVQKSVLCPDGVFVDERDHGDDCPNCPAVKLRRKTWRQDAEENREFAERLLAERNQTNAGGWGGGK